VAVEVRDGLRRETRGDEQPVEPLTTNFVELHLQRFPLAHTADLAKFAARRAGDIGETA
jgi:hypothetical protein